MCLQRAINLDCFVRSTSSSINGTCTVIYIFVTAAYEWKKCCWRRPRIRFLVAIQVGAVRIKRRHRFARAPHNFASHRLYSVIHTQRFIFPSKTRPWIRNKPPSHSPCRRRQASFETNPKINYSGTFLITIHSSLPRQSVAESLGHTSVLIHKIKWRLVAHSLSNSNTLATRVWVLCCYIRR